MVGLSTAGVFQAPHLLVLLGIVRREGEGEDPTARKTEPYT